jgi:predicted small secreted protein
MHEQPSGTQSVPGARPAFMSTPELDCAARFGEIAADLRGIFRMRKLIVLAAAASALLVASCNTIAGAGKDVSAAGKAVTRTADDAKH